MVVIFLIIDRFEECYAVCEDENDNIININRNIIPKEAVEGDVLINTGETITIDLERTEKRRQKLREMLSSLWQ